MSNLHAEAIAPEAQETRPMHASPLQPASPKPHGASTDADVYGNTFGLPFAAWWTMVLTLLVVIGWMLQVQIAR